MPVSVTALSAAKPRNRSIEALRAARLEKFNRERLVIDCLNRGVSVAETAVKLGVTEKRMRAIVREVLASRMPGPPEDFVALQISRLNEALLVAYSAMSGTNLGAVDRVVRIVRELDRYHGFFAADRRALGGSRPPAPTEAEAEAPHALLADRSETAPPPPSPRSGEGGPKGRMGCGEQGWLDADLGSCSCNPIDARGSGPHPIRRSAPPSPAELGKESPGDPRCGPEMAPQTPEKARSAPEKDGTPAASNEASASLARPPQAASAPGAPRIERPEMAPQAPEKAQSAPGKDGFPASSDEAFASLAGPAPASDSEPGPEAEPVAVADPDPATEAAPAADFAPLAAGGPDPAQEASVAAEAAPPPPAIGAIVLLPPNARRRPGPDAFTGSIRCAGQVTYWR